MAATFSVSNLTGYSHTGIEILVFRGQVFNLSRLMNRAVHLVETFKKNYAAQVAIIVVKREFNSVDITCC